MVLTLSDHRPLDSQSAVRLFLAKLNGVYFLNSLAIPFIILSSWKVKIFLVVSNLVFYMEAANY